MTPYLEKLGLTRDSLLWTVGRVATVIVGLAAFSDSAAASIGLPQALLPYLRLGAVIIGLVSGSMGNSPLKGK